jgi:polyribonucleotide nucleotidyltransferase
MATVCASTLALMDAGVPLKKPVAGIAMGLMSRETESAKRPPEGLESSSRAGIAQFKVLSDLQGYEDFYGDMDFKVAGTADGITAIQLDTKIAGITPEIIRTTLAQAKRARLEILGFMRTVLPEPRKEISPYVPKIVAIRIPKDKIGTLIGPGGKMINGLIEKYGLASIDIEEDGQVFVSAIDRKDLDAALAEIKALTREFKVGEIVEGRVVKILDFGAIVDLGGGRDGMVHVSELKSDFVKNVGDVVRLGDFVRAKIIRVEDDRIGLSMRQAEAEARNSKS